MRLLLNEKQLLVTMFLVGVSVLGLSIRMSNRQYLMQIDGLSVTIRLHSIEDYIVYEQRGRESFEKSKICTV